MANQTDVTILEDGPRNLHVRIAGVLDSGDLSLTPVISIGDCKGNDPNYSALIGFRVDGVGYSVDSVLSAILTWNGNNPQLIAGIADSNTLNWKSSGGLQPNQSNSGYDGGISVRTGGYISGDVVAFTLSLRLVKLYRP